jgi:hypothetical protein
MFYFKLDRFDNKQQQKEIYNMSLWSEYSTIS